MDINYANTNRKKTGKLRAIGKKKRMDKIAAIRYLREGKTS